MNIFKKVATSTKNFLKPYNDIQLLRKENQVQAIELENAKAFVSSMINNTDARKVVQAMIGRGLKYYEYEEMGYAEKHQYYKNVQDILKDPVILNEKKAMISDLVNQLAYEVDEENKMTIRDLRMTMNGIQLLFDRLEDIHPDKQVEDRETENSFSGI